MEAAYKGAPGLLELSQDGLVWRRRAQPSAPALTVGFSEIRVHCMSAASSAKLLLKVVTGSRDPKAPGFVFHFQSKLNAAGDRDTIVRGLLANRSGTNKPPDSGPTKKPVELPPVVAAVTEVPAIKDPLAGLRMVPKKRKRATSKTISAAQMAEALAARPTLAALYREQVPMVLSEAEFWGRYLSSEALHRSSQLHKGAAEPEEPEEAPATQQIASELNLSTELDSDPLEQPLARGSVIGQLNLGAKAFIHRIKKTTAVGSAAAVPMVDLRNMGPRQWLPMQRPARQREEARSVSAAKPVNTLRPGEPALHMTGGCTGLGGSGWVPTAEPNLMRCFEEPAEAHRMLQHVVDSTAKAAAASEVDRLLLASHAKVRGALVPADGCGADGGGAQGSELLRHFWAADPNSKRCAELLGCIQALLREVHAVTLVRLNDAAVVQLPEPTAGASSCAAIASGPLEALRCQLEQVLLTIRRFELTPIAQAGDSAQRKNDIHINQIAVKHIAGLQASLGIVIE